MYYLFYQPTICTTCLNKLEIIDENFTLGGYDLKILYNYNEFFQKQLYQFKGQYDQALASLFLEFFKEDLTYKYDDYIIVVLPSSDEDNEQRGFNANVELIQSLNYIPFIGLYKTQRYKQTDSNDRSQIETILQIKNGADLTNKKILIFDDVITSGHSLLAAIKKVELFNPKCIEIIVLASKQESRNKLQSRQD